ncbi:MAG TPA: PaaI family thioesterase [Ktedonobacteraceae bacterium]
MGEEQKSRSRTFSWEDPAEMVRVGKTLSGLAYLQAMQRGEVPPPPIATLMGMEVKEVSEGRVVFSLQPQEYHYNPLGTVHGGVAATLLDSAMGCTVQSVLRVGQWYTTLEIKVNYLRPLIENTGTVYCEGKIIHLGGRTATAEGRITDEAGKLYAHGTTTCIVLRP